MDILVVVDMQKDFISGALGTKEALAIVPRVAEKFVQAKKAGKTIVVHPRHAPRKLSGHTGGQNLPVPHCIENTDGWQLDPALDTAGAMIFDKPSFGSGGARAVPQEPQRFALCRSSSACALTSASSRMCSPTKCALPELPISVDSTCCAGVTPESHANALSAMRMCQIKID